MKKTVEDFRKETEFLQKHQDDYLFLSVTPWFEELPKGKVAVMVGRGKRKYFKDRPNDILIVEIEKTSFYSRPTEIIDLSQCVILACQDIERKDCEVEKNQAA